ncbi:UDP-glycosyltransferase-04 [Ephemera danica]|nr:UDP-glycosyltransferase-04 [Ephemera danica]
MKSPTISTVALFLCSACSIVISNENHSHKVLVLIPFNARSHKNMFLPIITELSSHGHKIDVISMFRSEELIENDNVTEFIIELDSSAPDFAKRIGDSAFEAPRHPFQAFMSVLPHMPTFCEHLFSRELVKTILRDLRPGVYNVVLLDAYICECFLPMVYLADAPLVLVAPSHLMPWHYETIGSPINYAKDAVFFLPHTDTKSWWETMESATLGTVAHLARDWLYLPRLQSVVSAQLKSILGPERAALVPTVWEIEEMRTQLLLVNWHWSLSSFVRPNPPMLIEVATMHCRESKPLPKDLEHFIAEAGEHGFVLFSMGSTLPGHKMPERLRRAFMDAFATLPQHVLWKLEKAPEEPLPNNVRALPWLPQQDLLGDGRLRAFITQAGMMSVQEAACHGAPVLAAPFIADQHVNAALLQRLGVGLVVDLHTADVSQLTWLLREITANSSYRESARRVARLLRDQPEKPQARAVWWLEYVMRHKGTRHLRPPHVSNPWLQRLHTVLVLLGITLVLYLPLQWIFHRFTQFCSQHHKKIE